VGAMKLDVRGERREVREWSEERREVREVE
jgi:hypothetical protein